MGGGKIHEDINDIVVTNSHITDKKQMAEEFNKFFSCIGKQISDSIPPSHTDPLSYTTNPPDIPNMEFHPCHPGQIIELVKNF